MKNVSFSSHSQLHPYSKKRRPTDAFQEDYGKMNMPNWDILQCAITKNIFLSQGRDSHTSLYDTPLYPLPCNSARSFMYMYKYKHCFKN